MGTSTLTATYEINGVIDTDKTVYQNMEIIAGSAASWVSYDTQSGLWSVVINQAGSSISSFDDSNIIGPISISGKGIFELYNSVRVNFPHKDLNDQRDFVVIEIPDADRHDNEPDNQMVIEYDSINDPVQAQYLGMIELKQSRVDKIISFVTDFSKLGLKAGDLIDVTSEVYGYTAKVFRIISITERDDDDGNIQLEISALEYDAAVYDTTDLYNYTVTTSTGIKTIGGIGTPGTPTITKYELTSRPRTVVTSTSPTGVVEGLEFWISIGGADYYLYRVIRPTTGTTFASGTSVSLDFDQLTPSVATNYSFKTRGFNATAVGPYSTAYAITVTPAQTADAITENTQFKDSSTGGLLTALTLASILNRVDGLFGGNTGIGGIFDKVFKLFESNTGVPILTESGKLGNLITAANSGTVTSTLISGSYTASGLANGTATNTLVTTIPLAPVTTGVYKIDLLADVNSSSSWGGRGNGGGYGEPEDLQAFRFDVYDGATSLGGAASGGVGAFYWSDYFMSKSLTLTAGVTYDMDIEYRYYSQTTGNVGTMNATLSYNVTKIG